MPDSSKPDAQIAASEPSLQSLETSGAKRFRERPTSAIPADVPAEERPAAITPEQEELLSVARELRGRSERLLERYAPAAQARADRLVMVGDAGVMEYAAGVIEKRVADDA